VVVTDWAASILDSQRYSGSQLHAWLLSSLEVFFRGKSYRIVVTGIPRNEMK